MKTKVHLQFCKREDRCNQEIVLFNNGLYDIEYSRLKVYYVWDQIHWKPFLKYNFAQKSLWIDTVDSALHNYEYRSYNWKEIRGK